ncbi:NusG domain II-containing protein [Ruminococcus sp.]|uniref:NusG domain II-containing protein n=1 Tax=Ruminococcus sp. TaxID=41978 RepID=UPI0025DEEE55|nr:NusG domain II-containing protein [Ruminococcus sp.]MBQ8966646.1 NusG domain II-containing protein [Ruminococcus sp.]
MTGRKIFILITAGLLAVSAVWCVYLAMRPAGEEIVISQDGKELYRIDLSRTPYRTIEVEYKGRKNVIEIKDGEVRMTHADCPDHICIETGKLRPDTPIVCLPNRLVIEYAGGGLDGTAR